MNATLIPRRITRSPSSLPVPHPHPHPHPLTRQPRRPLSSTPPKSEPNVQKHTQTPTPIPHPRPHPTASAPGASASASAGTGAGASSGSGSLIQTLQAGPAGRLVKAYSRVQDRRPYATQVVSSIVIYLCGDLSAQMLFPSDKASAGGEEGEGEKEEEEKGGKGGYDPYRTMRHLAVGVGSSIPTYKWFMFLHHHFNYSSKLLSILTKVCVQQAVFTPVFNTYFFSLQSLLTGKSFEETFERLKLALPVSITNSLKLWPAVTAFSFMYVAPAFRSIFSGVIAVGWQTYLSWLNQKAAREVEAERAIPVDVVGAVAMKV